ncbi:MAG: hypothetical protein N2322_03105 [Terrimicrobiaceae bacterium]|nr:hypothetical protein [Terrimicrobiaceae bacterium]
MELAQGKLAGGRGEGAMGCPEAGLFANGAAMAYTGGGDGMHLDGGR